MVVRIKWVFYPDGADTPQEQKTVRRQFRYTRIEEPDEVFAKLLEEVKASLPAVAGRAVYHAAVFGAAEDEETWTPTRTRQGDIYVTITTEKKIEERARTH